MGEIAAEGGLALAVPGILSAVEVSFIVELVGAFVDGTEVAPAAAAGAGVRFFVAWTPARGSTAVFASCLHEVGRAA